MAKQHKMTTVTLWIGGKQVVLNNTARLRYRLECWVKHDGAPLSSDYRHTFDLECSTLRLCELAKDSYTIKWQNDRLRPIAEGSAAKAYPRDYVVKYEDIFPGKSGGVRVLSDAEIKSKAKNDPEYRAQLLAELMAMDDTNEEAPKVILRKASDKE